MKKHIVIALAAIAFVLWLPAETHAASPAAEHLGKVLLDVSAHGEAWYVNPQTHMRVYLGRPADALERFRDRAIYVSFANVSRVPEDPACTCEPEYRKAVAGMVLAPDDLVGAAWYVDPSTGTRRRLATPDDAWQIMRTGTPASSATLKAIPVEVEQGAAKTEVARVKDVKNADTLVLENGGTVRILNVDTPSNPELQEAAAVKLRALVKDGTILLERDAVANDVDGAKLRHVHVGGANLGYELVRNGLAFHDITFPSYKYAELYIVGGLDAARLRKGFWDNPSNK